MNINDIFDAVAAFAEETIRQDKIREKQEEIAEAQRKVCGHCFKWMKSTCIPEKKHGQFKSMNSLACGLFEAKRYSLELAERRKEELTELGITHDNRP